MLELRHSSLRVQLMAVCAIVFTPFHSFSFLSLLESTSNSTHHNMNFASKECFVERHPLLPLVLWRLFVVSKEESLGTHPLLRMALWRLFVTSKQCFMGTHPLLRRGLGRPFVTSKQCFMGTHPLLRRGLGRPFILYYGIAFRGVLVLSGCLHRALLPSHS